MNKKDYKDCGGIHPISRSKFPRKLKLISAREYDQSYQPPIPLWEETCLTVKELIKLLQQINQDLIVQTEGCDCDSDAIGIEVSDKSSCYPNGYVLITRK